MSPLIKAAVAGAGGALLGDMIEPYLVKWFKPETDFAKKAAKAGAIGVGTGGIFYVMGLVSKGG